MWNLLISSNGHYIFYYLNYKISKFNLVQIRASYCKVTCFLLPCQIQHSDPTRSLRLTRSPQPGIAGSFRTTWSYPYLHDDHGMAKKLGQADLVRQLARDGSFLQVWYCCLFWLSISMTRDGFLSFVLTIPDMDSTLRYNNLRCRTHVHERAVVTTCR